MGRGREGDSYAKNRRENRGREYDQLPPPVDRRGSGSDHRVNLVEQNGRFTPLNVSKAEIFTAIKDKGLLSPPKPIAGGQGGNAHHKYCEFHKVSGHGTADCMDLNEQIEWLVQNQYLKEYVSNQRRNGRGGDIGGNVTMMITGGPTIAGDSNRSRKNYSRYSLKSYEVNFNVPIQKTQLVQRVPIMFTDEDEEAVTHPHEDALVVKVTLAGQELHRALVDGGSSIDILFKQTLDGLQIDDFKMDPIRTSLKGFGGAELIPLGVIDLPLTIGSSPLQKTVMVTWVVVDEPSPYQVILGRPFNRIAGAVSSTHMQCVKFRVQGGVGVMRGQQQVARSCYATAARESMQITSLNPRAENKLCQQ